MMHAQTQHKGWGSIAKPWFCFEFSAHDPRICPVLHDSHLSTLSTLQQAMICTYWQLPSDILTRPVSFGQ